MTQLTSVTPSAEPSSDLEGGRGKTAIFASILPGCPRIPPTSWSLSVSSRGILIDRVGGEGPRVRWRGANSPLGFLQDKIQVVSACSSLSFSSPCLYAFMHFKMPFRCSFVCCPEVFFISATAYEDDKIITVVQFYPLNIRVLRLRK